jgi:hypothetical protein
MAKFLHSTGVRKTGLGARFFYITKH